MGASSDPTLVRLRPIQEATFLRWLAQEYRYRAGRVDSGKGRQVLFFAAANIQKTEPLCDGSHAKL